MPAAAGGARRAAVQQSAFACTLGFGYVAREAATRTNVPISKPERESYRRIRLLLAAARLIAFANPGCAGSAEESGAAMKPAVAGSELVPVVTASGAPTNVTTAPHVAPDLGRGAVSDDADTDFEIAISNAVAADPSHPAPASSSGKPRARSTAASLGLAIDETALLKAGGDPDAADVPSGPLPMFGATVLQHVRDFDTWRAAFDETLQERKRAGFVSQGVMRGVDDPRLVAVVLAVTDVAQAKAYFGDKALNERMSRAGATGRPRVLLSSNLTAKMEPGRTGLHAAILRLRVNDVDAFKATVDAQTQERAAAGIVGYALGQDVDDPHLAYLYLQSEESAQLRAYVFGKQTKQTWRDAGLQGDAILTMVKEEDLALCR